MNHIYKTLWSAVHQQYVVTNEKQASHGKPSKAVLTAVVASAVMAMAGNAVAYQETGVIGDSASWKTAEYKADWGLDAMHAADAYALGFNGKGAVVGMMDTGALDSHPEFSKERFKYVTYKPGFYSSTGNRYPVPGFDTFGNGAYEIGQSFVDSLSNKGQAGEVKQLTGAWILHVNDSHGTHVVGTIGANRDGKEMHGVAWGADVIVGNNGGLDNSNYGPYQDYNFYKSVYEDTVKGVDGKAPKFINSSWGTNMRVWGEVKDAETGKVVAGVMKNASVPVNTVKDTEYEYFIFNNHARDNWNKAEKYNEGKEAKDKIAIPDNKLANFVDAIYESVKGQKVVHMITTGNREYNQPYYRANYPYFTPNAEHHWVAVAGLQQVKGQDGKFENIEVFNDPGEAKWWSVVAPGRAIYSSVVCEDTYVEPDENHKLGGAYYDTFSGTSMANPHVTGALGVFASRYAEMTPFQVRDTMLTTANHRNEDGSVMDRWTAAEGVPDVKYGWGVPDLNKGMFGPGQFLGMLDDEGKFHKDFVYELKGNDVWSNDISQVAHDARLKEEAAWLENVYKPWKEKIGSAEGEVIDSGKAAKLAKDKSADFEGEFVLGNVFTGGANYVVEEDGKKVYKKGTVTAEVVGSYKQDSMTPEQIAKYKAEHPEVKDGEIPNINPIVGEPDNLAKVALEDAILWRDMAYETRAAAINKRIAAEKLGLVKQGTGTLVMTGHNTYKGTTTVKDGTLLAFSESIGDKNVTVENGTFGLLNHYEDKALRQGMLESDHSADGQVTVNLANGASLLVSAFDNVSLKNIEGEGKKVLFSTEIGADPVMLAKVYHEGMKSKDGMAEAGSLTLLDENASFEGFTFDKDEIKNFDKIGSSEDSTEDVANESQAPESEQAVGEGTEGTVEEVVERTVATPLMAAPVSQSTPVGLFDVQTPEFKGKVASVKVKVDKANTLVADLEKAVAPASSNEKAVFDALVQDDNAVFGEAVAAAKAGDVKTAAPVVKAAVAGLSDETVAVARNVLVNSNMNVLNTALRGAHDGLFLRTAKTDDANLWIDGSVTKGHVKAQDGKFKTTFDTLVIGGDYHFSSACKAGAFIGYGHDKAKNDPAQIKMDDLHAGIYAMGDIADVELTAVASYTYADRKINAPFYSSELSDKAKVYNVYGEAALPVSVKEDVRVTPYVGAGYMHVKGEDMSTKIAGLPVTFEGESSNVGYAKLGARAEGVVYHGAADVALKADAGYTQFFGDKTAEQKVAFGESASATVKTKKLGGLFNIGLGVNAKFSEKVEGELSYRGDFGKAINANGVFGSIKVHF